MTMFCTPFKCITKHKATGKYSQRTPKNFKANPNINSI